MGLLILTVSILCISVMFLKGSVSKKQVFITAIPFRNHIEEMRT